MHDNVPFRIETISLYGTFTDNLSIHLTIILQLDLDDLTVDNAYFKSFDAVVRRQLDPVWHQVGPRTKQLVSDLATLRRLLM